MADPLPLVIDCDTGRDDALALWVARMRGMRLAGIVASYGNVPLDQVIENTARVLGLAGGENIPFFAGMAGPLRAHKGWRDLVLPRQAVSGNGLCNLDLPGGEVRRPSPASPEGLAERIAALAEKTGPLDYAILGPATNFAQLCRIFGQDIKKYIARVTMLGGRMERLWDETPVADFNVLCDPFAVREILERGIGLRFVTLNTTWPIALTLEALEKLVPHSALGETAKELMIAHTRHFAPEPVFRFHDPAMVLAITQEELYEAVKITVDDHESSPSFGRLIRAESGFPAFLHRATRDVQDRLRDDILAALSLSHSD